jgi:vacuolar-type H+-ATPase subunit I/STV1
MTMVVVGVGIYSFSTKEAESVTSGDGVTKSTYISHTETVSPQKSSVNRDSFVSKESASSSDKLVKQKDELRRDYYNSVVSSKTKSYAQRDYYKKLHQQKVEQQKQMLKRHEERQKALAMNIANQNRAKNSQMHINQMKYKMMHDQKMQQNIFQNKSMNNNS